LLGGPLAQVFVTDSLPLNIDYDKLKIVSVAPILAGAIARWTITS
jgi:phosphoribosylpyrophosphate synthetase